MMSAKHFGVYEKHLFTVITSQIAKMKNHIL